ncbi:MAG: M1 family metallopeptidase [Saprospiraceae bacterium]
MPNLIPQPWQFRLATPLLAFVLLLQACAPAGKIARNEGLAGKKEKVELDTLFVKANKPSALKGADEYALNPYNPSHTRENDLLHTRLELRFDFQAETVIGKAVLDLKPFFHPVRTLTLDAKDFQFYKVSFAGENSDLPYTYDGKNLIIELGKTFTRDQRYTVLIEYLAKPSATGGSAAITSNQGLFFINPRAEEPDKPTQIWTQGETEWNSRWFPTIDKPNERSTQEILLTVPKRFTSLSNGLLINSTDHSDGTRTDHWKMDQPHAPYLFMLAIGEYAVVKDSWKGKEVAYYVEPEYAESARDIFAHTPEMLGFFSEKLGIDYPWPKYAQIVVRDYVSGAMENTTASVFGEFVQKHRRELLDDHNDKIVAHELIHQWFGNYVTCESWANLTMNEGFANYSEYLWLEHKYGKDEADFHLLQEWQGYLQTSPDQLHPLIHFGYEDNEEMFDAHSYNKGGAVLHMLRNHLGDEAFFSGLNLYLTQNAFKTAEAHQLRLALEEVSGEDLNWFFNQWYFSSGHPELNITYGFDAQSGAATVMVEQTQNPDRYPAIFDLPLTIAVYSGGMVQRHPVRINQRVQKFSFKCAQKPDLIILDSERTILGEFRDNLTDEQLVFQFLNSTQFLDRFDALRRLTEKESAQLTRLYPAALQDRHWAIRTTAIEGLQNISVPNIFEILQKLALRDLHSEVRAMALLKLTALDTAKAHETANEAMKNDSAYSVLAIALEILYQADPQAGIQAAASLENEKSEDIIVAISEIYKVAGNAEQIPFFEKNLRKLNAFNAIQFIGNYQEFAFSIGTATADRATETLKSIALDITQNPWRRLGATRALNDMGNAYRKKADSTRDAQTKANLEAKVASISKALDEIKFFEPNEELKAIYQQFELNPRD